MTDEELSSKIYVENTPDIIICLARAVQELQSILGLYRKYLNVSYWHNLYDDTKKKCYNEVCARVTAFSHCVNAIDSSDTYISLNEDERLKYVSELFFKNIDFAEIDLMIKETDPSRFIARLPIEINERIAYDPDVRYRAYWNSICPHHDSLLVLRKAAMKIKNVCTGIKVHLCDVEQNELIRKSEQKRQDIRQEVHARISMVNDIYSQFLVCMQLYRSYVNKTGEIFMSGNTDATRDLQFALEALHENHNVLNADIILSCKKDKELETVSYHKKKYLEGFELEKNLPQPIDDLLSNCKSWLNNTCNELIAHYNGDLTVKDRHITKENKELFGNDNSRNFRIMEIALDDKESGLVTWNYETSRYEWHGTNQQLAYFMGALFLDDRISNGSFVFKKDLKGTSINALVSQYWLAFCKTDFAQTRSMMKGDKAFPTDENYDIIQGWFSYFEKVKRMHKDT